MRSGFYLALHILGLLARQPDGEPVARPRVDAAADGAGQPVSLGAAAFLAAVLGGGMGGPLGVPLVVLPMAFFTFGAGLASPAALTQAFSVNPLVAGSASGLYGFSQMGIGAICTSLAGLGGNPALAAAVVLVGAGVLAQVAFWVALRR